MQQAGHPHLAAEFKIEQFLYGFVLRYQKAQAAGNFGEAFTAQERQELADFKKRHGIAVPTPVPTPAMLTPTVPVPVTPLAKPGMPVPYVGLPQMLPVMQLAKPTKAVLVPVVSMPPPPIAAPLPVPYATAPPMVAGSSRGGGQGSTAVAVPTAAMARLTVSPPHPQRIGAIANTDDEDEAFVPTPVSPPTQPAPAPAHHQTPPPPVSRKTLRK